MLDQESLKTSLEKFHGTINELALLVHEANFKWWLDPSTPCRNCTSDNFDNFAFNPDENCPHCKGYGHEKKERNLGEMLALVNSELCEAMEGHRKDIMDSHLPNRKSVEVELADALIRLLDLAAGTNTEIYWSGKTYFNDNTFHVDSGYVTHSPNFAEEILAISSSVCAARARLTLLTSIIIKIASLGEHLNLNLAGAFKDKMLYNMVRHDHTMEARRGAGGKKY